MHSLLVLWLPALTVLLAIAVQELSLPFYGWSVFRPNLVLLCLFYWRLYRPDRCGPGLAFVSGLAVDVFAGLPLGLSAVTHILLILTVSRFGSRLRAADFLFVAPILAILVVVEQGLQLGALALLQGPEARWSLAGGRVLATTLASAPVISWLIWVHRSWLESA